MDTAGLTKGLIFEPDALVQSDYDIFEYVDENDECRPVKKVAELIHKGDTKIYTAHSETASLYMREGFLNIKTAASLPYVSVAVEISQKESQISTTRARTTYFQATKFYPKARFTVDALIASGYLKLSSEFLKAVQAVASSKTEKDRATNLKPLRENYGLVWINKVQVGGSLFQTTTEEVKDSSDEQKKSMEVKAAFKVSDGISSVSGEVDQGQSTTTKNTQSKTVGSDSLSSVGGDPATNPSPNEWARSVDNFDTWSVINYEDVRSILKLPGITDYAAGLELALKESAKKGDKAAQKNALMPEEYLTQDAILTTEQKGYRLAFTKTTDGKSNVFLSAETAPTVPLWTGPYPGTEQLYFTVGGRLQFQTAAGDILHEVNPQSDARQAKLTSDGRFVLTGAGDTIVAVIGQPTKLVPESQLLPNALLVVDERDGDGTFEFGVVNQDEGSGLVLRKRSKKGEAKTLWMINLNVGRQTVGSLTKDCNFIIGQEGGDPVFDSRWYAKASGPFSGKCYLEVGQEKATLFRGQDEAWSTDMPHGFAIMSPGGSVLTAPSNKNYFTLEAYANKPNQHWRLAPINGAWRIVNLQRRTMLRYTGDWGGDPNRGTIMQDSYGSGQGENYWFIEREGDWCAIGSRRDDSRRLRSVGDRTAGATDWNQDEVRWTFRQIGSPTAPNKAFNCDGNVLFGFSPKLGD